MREPSHFGSYRPLVRRDSFAGVALARRRMQSDAIRAVLDNQVAAWNRGDIDGFMTGYARSPTTTFVSGDEVTHGWQTVRDRYAKKYDSREKMGTLTFSDLTITPLCDDAAIVLGSWSLERKERSSRTANSPCSFASCRKAGGSCSIIHRRVRRGRSDADYLASSARRRSPEFGYNAASRASSFS